MGQPSGFVPTNFTIAGKLLLLASGVGLALYGVSLLSGWFALPRAVVVLALAAIPVSLYMIAVDRRRHE